MALLLCSCGGSETGSSEGAGYTQLSQEEAIAMMEESKEFLIIDVRTQEEYDEGHIPDAICIPNEEIGDTPPAQLSSLEQRMFIYCRSGRRSKEAAQKLADMGYTNVYEMGGINTWPGEVVRDDEETAGLLLLEVNGQTLEAELEENQAAQALIKLIGEDGLKLELEEYGGFEKVGPLPENLPANDEQMDAKPGDIVLYQGNQLSLFYGENSWSYTKLGHVKDRNGTLLREILGEGDVSVILRKAIHNPL